MKNFYENLEETIGNQSYTENGALGYKTTHSAMLDALFNLASFRRDDEKRNDHINALLGEKDPYLLKFMFYVRDIRGGLGERETFRQFIAKLDQVTLFKIIPLIPEFGRWDDLFVLFDTCAENAMVDFVLKQLNKDIKSKAPSLLAKWMPSINATSEKTKELARRFIMHFGWTQREYRKTLSTLRAKIDVLERKLCAGKFSEVNYNTVPSKANVLYADTFLRHDETRRREFLAKLAVGDKSVKINSSVNFPHDIVRKYYESGSWFDSIKPYDQTLESLWKNLKEVPGLKDTIVVRDGSDSMQGDPQTIADALSVYCAQHNTQAFKNRVITFSHRPEFINFDNPAECGSLHSILKKLLRHTECENTNVKAVFDLILNVAISHKFTAEDLPKQILIISDMEFDEGCECIPLMDEIAKQWATAGYKLPKLIFWNVASRTSTIPMKENENGVLLISGFSQNILEMVNNGETDPYKALIKTLNGPKYAKVPKYEI